MLPPINNAGKKKHFVLTFVPTFGITSYYFSIKLREYFYSKIHVRREIYENVAAIHVHVPNVNQMLVFIFIMF